MFNKQMDKLPESKQIAIPLWLKVGATLSAVIGLIVLAAIEIEGTYKQSWISYLLIAVIFIPIQIITEGILSAYWESSKWVNKVIPAVLLACFYAVVVLLK